jgi:hypothetical protein
MSALMTFSAHDRTVLSIGAIFGILSFVQVAYVVVSAFILSYGYFKWTNSKLNVDFEMSLPVTKEERYISGFIGGLVMVLVPYMLSGLAAINIAFALIPHTQAITLYTSSAQIYAYSLLFESSVCILFGYCFITGIGSFVARSRDKIVIPVVVAGILPMIAVSVAGLIYTGLIGVDFAQRSLIDVMGASSPFGYYLYKFIQVSQDIMQGQTSVNGMTVWAIVYSVLLFLLGLVVHHLRTPERTGNAFAFRKGYEVFTAAGIFAIVATEMYITSVSDANRVYTDRGVLAVLILVTTFIPFAISHLSNNNGFHKVLKGIVFYAVTVAVSVLVCLALPMLKGFGAQEYIPPVEQVQEAYFADYPESIITSNPEEIRVIENEQRNILKWNKNFENYTQGDTQNYYLVPEYANYDSLTLHTHIRINYTLKNGKHITRLYRYDPNNISEEIKQLLYTPEQLQSKVNDLQIKDDSFVELVDPYYIDQDQTPDNITFSAEQSKQILDAYKQDVLSRTYESVKNSNGGRILAEMRIKRPDNDEHSYWYVTAILTDADKNTLAAIESMGYNPDFMQKLADKRKTVFLTKHTGNTVKQVSFEIYNNSKDWKNYTNDIGLELDTANPSMHDLVNELCKNITKYRTVSGDYWTLDVSNQYPINPELYPMLDELLHQPPAGVTVSELGKGR